MKIAVTYLDGNVFGHFGHSEAFKIYDIESGQVKSAEVVAAPANGHGALAGFLASLGADTLICGGIGMGARVALGEAGITVYGGVDGEADKAVAALLSGTLEYDPDAACSHHGHGEEGHSCGSHSCSDHHCGH